jgi:hypothetical protein
MPTALSTINLHQSIVLYLFQPMLFVMKIKKSDDLYNKVIQQINSVREQGDPPRSDVMAMDSFICDLCKDSISKQNLTQCAFCGRWICRKNCWDNDNMACISCSGIIKLSKDSLEISAKQSENEKKRKKPKKEDVTNQKNSSSKFNVVKKIKK